MKSNQKRHLSGKTLDLNQIQVADYHDGADLCETKYPKTHLTRSKHRVQM